MLSMLLSLVMFCSLMPVMALAGSAAKDDLTEYELTNDVNSITESVSDAFFHH